MGRYVSILILISIVICVCIDRSTSDLNCANGCRQCSKTIWNCRSNDWTRLPCAKIPFRTLTQIDMTDSNLAKTRSCQGLRRMCLGKFRPSTHILGCSNEETSTSTSSASTSSASSPASTPTPMSTSSTTTTTPSRPTSTTTTSTTTRTSSATTTTPIPTSTRSTPKAIIDPSRKSIGFWGMICAKCIGIGVDSYPWNAPTGPPSTVIDRDQGGIVDRSNTSKDEKRERKMDGGKGDEDDKEKMDDKEKTALRQVTTTTTEMPTTTTSTFETRSTPNLIRDEANDTSENTSTENEARSDPAVSGGGQLAIGAIIGIAVGLTITGVLIALAVLIVYRKIVPIVQRLRAIVQRLRGVLYGRRQEDVPRTPVFKMVVIGERGVGKTSLVKRRYLDEAFDSCQSPSTHVFFKMIDHVHNDRLTRLAVWDFPGDLGSKIVHDSAFRDVRIALFVFDLTSADSFTKVNRWVDKFHRTADAASVVKILVGNKLDLTPQARSLSLFAWVNQRAVDRKTAERYAHRNNMIYREASAKSEENVHAIFDDAVMSVRRQERIDEATTMV